MEHVLYFLVGGVVLFSIVLSFAGLMSLGGFLHEGYRKRYPEGRWINKRTSDRILDAVLTVWVVGLLILVSYSLGLVLILQ